MKTRLAFVPNSSSSSFIVDVWSHFILKKGRKLSPALEQKLIKFGFKKTNCAFPDQYDYIDDQCKKEDFEDIEGSKYYYGYAVTCNQSDVIEFLVKYRIPFTASIHYGHYTYYYDGGDLIYSFPNYGIMFHRDRNEKNMEESIGRMLLEERGIERLCITQFMNKKDQDVYSRELRKRWELKNKQRKDKAAKKVKK